MTESARQWQDIITYITVLMVLRMQVMNRAVLAGQLLAHVLMSGAHGGRPVTLIGFSMGARYALTLVLYLDASVISMTGKEARHPPREVRCYDRGG